MSFGNIIGGLLQQRMSGSSERRLRTGAEDAERTGGLDRTVETLLSRGRGQGNAGGLADLARNFLGNKQAGGLSGAQIGGLGALVGAFFGGGGIRGAARGGTMAILGTLALRAWRQHQAEQTGASYPAEASSDEADALTDPKTEQLVLRAMIGAAQADGHIDDAEMERILGRMGDDGVTEEERQEARREAARPVDVDELGARVTRPEVATEVYLAALLAVEVDTEAEKDYLRRLAGALRLDHGLVQRLHRMTKTPEP